MDDIISEVASCSVFFMGRAYGGVVGALSFNVCVQLRPRLSGGGPRGRDGTKDWSAFDKFDYRTVKDGPGQLWSGFTSDSRKELIGRSPVRVYEPGRIRKQTGRV